MCMSYTLTHTKNTPQEHILIKSIKSKIFISDTQVHKEKLRLQFHLFIQHITDKMSPDISMTTTELQNKSFH